ncbi:DUF2487 family protein [Paenibacillus sp. NPDC058071]|uniref:DUF2487 family protein n=1 Tax=Paenibacillus sp. NPDC058071 TaxID=3346326 RepID=UPI0036DECAAB
MKFSDLSAEEWGALQPYLDTCLLPVTSLTGEEQPHEATAALEKLRDVMDLIEIPFKGRVVTYPALHYIEETSRRQTVAGVCAALKRTGFKHVIAVVLGAKEDYEGAGPDLIVSIGEAGVIPDAKDVSKAVQLLWNAGNDR